LIKFSTIQPDAGTGRTAINDDHVCYFLAHGGAVDRAGSQRFLSSFDQEVHFLSTDLANSPVILFVPGACPTPSAFFSK
jgi:hypothetical protein